MRNLLLRLLFTVLIFVSATAAHAVELVFKQANTLSVCSYSEFRPVIYGDGEGYEADLLRAVAELWQVKVQFFPERIYEGIWRLPSRSYTLCDVSAGGMTPTLSRLQEGTQFSAMTTLFDQSLLVRKQDFVSGKIVAYRSFKNTNLKIGVVPGTTGEKYAYARAKENGLPLTIFVQYASESQLLPALLNHKIDAIARGEIGNKYQASLNQDLVTIAKKKCDEGFAFAVDKNNPRLTSALNEAIREITNNGMITFDDWFKDHTVFSRRAKQILALREVPAPTLTMPSAATPTIPAPAKPIPEPPQPAKPQTQTKEPDRTPSVMV
jgi:ABC-type amino acid transport substrate-binding protein